METRRGFDPVLVEGRAARVKAKMPIPRPVAMGILPTPSVDFDVALMAAWRAENGRRISNSGGTSSSSTNSGVSSAMVDCNRSFGGGAAPGVVAGAAALGREGATPVATPIAAAPAAAETRESTTAAEGSSATAPTVAVDNRSAETSSSGSGSREARGPPLGASLPPQPATSDVGVAKGKGEVSKGEEMDEERREEDPSSSSSSGTTSPPISPAGAGAGSAVWEGARTRGCYENVPGPKQRMRIYCFRSPPGEMDGWVPKKKVRKQQPEETGEGVQESEGAAEGGGARGEGEEGERKEEDQQEKKKKDKEEDEDEEEHEVHVKFPTISRRGVISEVFL